MEPIRDQARSVRPLQIDHIMARIEKSFGSEPMEVAPGLSEANNQTLESIMLDPGYQDAFEDLANRQIIRNYLINAVLLGFIPLERLESCTAGANTPEGRATLSLHMLMSAIEQAEELLLNSVLTPLSELACSGASPPQLTLVNHETES